MYIQKTAKCKVAQSISKSAKKREKSKNIEEALNSMSIWHRDSEHRGLSFVWKNFCCCHWMGQGCQIGLRRWLCPFHKNLGSRSKLRL